MTAQPFTVIDVPQGSPEWFAARLGRLTGSRAKDMLATIKSGEAAARRDYRLQLALERIIGQPQEDGFVSEDMRRGTELEPEAFAAYEAKTGEMVLRSGFLAHPTLLAGCSLDGHVGDYDGIVELKCPKSATHLRVLRAGVCPPEHLAQVTHNLWVSGAAWCDFVSYDPRFPEGLRLFVVRVPRDESKLREYQVTVESFLAEVDHEVEAVRTMAGVGDVLREALA